jgi:hypothetical protein
MAATTKTGPSNARSDQQKGRVGSQHDYAGAEHPDLPDHAEA